MKDHGYTRCRVTQRPDYRLQLTNLRAWSNPTQTQIRATRFCQSNCQTSWIWFLQVNTFSSSFGLSRNSTTPYFTKLPRWTLLETPLRLGQQAWYTPLLYRSRRTISCMCKDCGNGKRLGDGEVHGVIVNLVSRSWKRDLSEVTSTGFNLCSL